MSVSQARVLIVLLAATCLVVGSVGGFLASQAISPAQAEVGSADATTATYGDTADNFVVPYDGYLMLDSTPLNGTIELEFRLYEEDAGTIAASAEWSEQQTITAYNGRFSVGLGSTTRLNEDLLDADQLFLEIAIVNADGSTTVLGGYQAIEPVPYAIWSAHAANLSVAGTLATGGSATLGDATSDSHTANGSLAVTNALTVNGNTVLGNDSSDTVTTAGYLTTGSGMQVGISDNWLAVTGTHINLGTNLTNGYGDGGSALVVQASDTLHVNYNGDFSGGTVVGSALTATGTLTAGSSNLDITPNNSWGRLRSQDGVAVFVDGDGSAANTDAVFNVSRGTSFSDDTPLLNVYGDGDLHAAGDLQVNGNNIDSDSDMLGLNRITQKPIRIHADTSSTLSTGGDSAPESYSSRNGTVAGVTCGSSSHGALVVGRASGRNDREGLCVCLRDGLTSTVDYQWVCFTP